MTGDETVLRDQVRQLVAEYARLRVPIAQLGDDGDLFGAGMSSHASVSVMVALEEVFGVEFPEVMQRKSVFGSVSSIARALLQLRSVAA